MPDRRRRGIADSTGAAGGQQLRGVPLDSWRFHVGNMLCLVTLWDLLQARDRERLAPHIVWKDGKDGVSVHFDSHPAAGKADTPALGFKRARAVIASREKQPELLERFTPGDPVLPGWVYLCQAIDGYLFDAGVAVNPEMTWDPARERPTLRHVAPTLLTAVLYQLADAVDNGRVFARCLHCGKPFLVAPEAARTHRRFCSTSCRLKAYRARMDLARRMHAGGKTFEEIAEELGSDVVTVKGWVTGVKG
jgi:hypothetical protein